MPNFVKCQREGCGHSYIDHTQSIDGCMVADCKCTGFECDELRWLYRDVLLYPDPTKPGMPYEPFRYRAIGVRSDGQLFQYVALVSQLEMERSKALGQDLLGNLRNALFARLDRDLKTKVTEDGPAT